MKRVKNKILADQFFEALKKNESIRDYRLYSEGVEAMARFAEGANIARLESVFQNAPYSTHDILNVMSGILAVISQEFNLQHNTKYYPIES